MKISVMVIAKNEVNMIAPCLESVSWADEIVVADNGSSDQTVEIAKKFTPNIISYKGNDFASLRNKALDNISGDWLLCVDADERVLSSLKKEILSLVERRSDFSAWAISRRNIVFGKEVNYGPFWPDWVIRLFKTNNLKGWKGKIHEQPEFEGALGYTKNSFLHLTHRNLDSIVKKSLEWSEIDARLRYDTNHPKISSWRLIRILVTEVFNQGILRKGFFSGTVGTSDALLQTFSLVMSYIRLWEYQQKPPLSTVYSEIDQKLRENDFTF